MANLIPNTTMLAATETFSETAVTATAGDLSHDDHIFSIVGNHHMIRRLISDPVATVAEATGIADFRGESGPNVTILFSYTDATVPMDQAETAQYVVEGIATANILNVRAVRLLPLAEGPESVPPTTLWELLPSLGFAAEAAPESLATPQVLHIRKTDNPAGGSPSLYSHFHIEDSVANRQALRDQIAVIALSPDSFITILNATPQMEFESADVSHAIEEDQRLTFQLPSGGAAESVTAPGLRYLYQWTPGPALETTTCTCNKTLGVVNGTTVTVDTFLTTTYACPTNGGG